MVILSIGSSPFVIVLFHDSCFLRSVSLHSFVDPRLSFYGYVNNDLKSDFCDARSYRRQKKIAEPSL